MGGVKRNHESTKSVFSFGEKHESFLNHKFRAFHNFRVFVVLFF